VCRQQLDDDLTGLFGLALAQLAQDLEVVNLYVREKWTVSRAPTEAFDPASPTPPLTMTGMPLESRIWRRGKSGTGPFERVMIRAGSR
jgi:hypothetical protein